MEGWIDHSIEDLKQLAQRRGQNVNVLARLMEGLAITASDTISSHTDRTRPSLFIPGLRSKPWWDANEFRWCNVLENALCSSEVSDLSLRGTATKTVENHRCDLGEWQVRYLLCIGQREESNIREYAKEWQLVQLVPGVSKTGMVFLSKLSAQSHIAAHFGFTNAHLRCHLPLRAKGGAYMRVGDEIRYWEQGKVTVFDDTYEHEVWNDSDDPRVLLSFDIVHPDLTQVEIEGLSLIMLRFRREFVRKAVEQLVATPKTAAM